jgi:hypothetical protein
MSTTTNFKRIALVAVAALGMGVLSSVPAQASVANLTLTVANGTSLAGKSDSSNAAVLTVAGLVDIGVGDSITVTFIEKDITANTSAVARMIYLDTATGASSATLVSTGRGAHSGATKVGNSVVPADSKLASAAPFVIHSPSASYVGAKFMVQLESTTASTGTAGVFTYTALVSSYAGATLVSSTSSDFTITVAALASASVTVDPSKSTAFLGAGSSAATADAAISAVATAADTVHGTLSVRTYNASGSAAAESVTVSISGAGILKTGSVSGSSLVIASSGGSGASNGDISVLADGRAGVGTITVKTTTTTFSNKSITFYAKAAKTITATVGTPLLKVGPNAKAVRGVAVDATGVAWTGTAYIVASSAADALVGGSATTPVQCDSYDTANARHNCPVTTLTTGTAKFKIIDAATVALATATSNEITVTVTAGTPASVKVEFDKATYAPNERAMIYVTPLDAAGKAMESRAYTQLFSSTGITVNGALSYANTTTTADSITGTAIASLTTAEQTSSTSRARAGSMQFTVYMPSSGGVVTLTATGGASLPVAAQTANAVTATATVTDSGAAALAAVTALATTVASLKTLITTLTNLVLKIQKKVKA